MLFFCVGCNLHVRQNILQKIKKLVLNEQKITQEYEKLFACFYKLFFSIKSMQRIFIIILYCRLIPKTFTCFKEFIFYFNN